MSKWKTNKKRKHRHTKKTNKKKKGGYQDNHDKEYLKYAGDLFKKLDHQKKINLSQFQNDDKTRMFKENNELFKKKMIDLYNDKNKDFKSIVFYFKTLNQKQLTNIGKILGIIDSSSREKSDLVLFFSRHAYWILFQALHNREDEENLQKTYDKYIEDNEKSKEIKKSEQSKKLEAFFNFLNEKFEEVKNTLKHRWRKNNTNVTSTMRNNNTTSTMRNNYTNNDDSDNDTYRLG